MNRPLISVVTPFFNTSKYLAQCIESVLSQSYMDFEYILSDNCSTDGSADIAQHYAHRDARIRMVRQPEFAGQVAHYNRALAQISPASEYCKVVQADDYLFPACLELMVKSFQVSETIGLVSSYDLKGITVRGSGFPLDSTFLDGREMARLYLRTGIFVFGSPTTVMYRSSLVRGEKGFYREDLVHEDSEKCMEILEHWDFGFVYQVLSFLRADNDSITSSTQYYQPRALDRYIMVSRFAGRFLEPQEARALIGSTRRAYYSVLAEEAIRGRTKEFWRYHEKGLQTLGESLDKQYLYRLMAGNATKKLLNPQSSLALVYNSIRRRWERAVR